MDYIKVPMSIEVKSFEIIDEIVASMGRDYPDQTKHIYQRVIHTSADFDYLDTLKINPELKETLRGYLGKPLSVYTDTNMAKAGINKKAFEKTGWTLSCLVDDPIAWKISKEKGITRSMAAIEHALLAKGPKLFVIGNAPTAIFKLLESDLSSCVGIIGVPVGFVGAVESKDALYENKIPSIVALGRKGGSNVAAAIVNAILYDLIGRD